MIPRVKFCVTLLFISIAIFIAGCEHSSDDIPTGVPIDVPSLIASGWSNFEAGNYEQAISDFSEAAARDALEIEAYLGLGWGNLRDTQYSTAKANIDNVYSLLNLGLVSDPDDSNRYVAESSACLVGINQGFYPNDIATYAPLVIENVDETLALLPDFVFSHDATVNRTSLLVAKADAYFALSQFDQSLYTISEVDSAIFQNPQILQTVIDQSVLVETLFDSTTSMGYARLTIPPPQVEIIQVQLIGVISVTDDSLIDSNEDFVAYSIAGFTQGGNEITFYGTPIPQTGDYFLASYYNSPDYITFLAELRELIDDHR